MRTAHRILATAVAMVAFIPLSIPAAHADQSTENAATGTWFWSEQVSGEIVPGSGQPYPGQLPQSSSGIPDHDLGVAKTPDKPSDKEAFLSWDLTTVPLDATITSFTISIPLDPAANQLDQGGVKVQACGPKTGWGPADADSYANKPALDCAKPALGAYDAATKSYKFDISELARTWLTGDNFGIGLNPTSDATPFQIAFLPASNVKAVIVYDALPVVSLPPVSSLPPGPAPVTNTGTTTVGGIYTPDTPLPAPSAQDVAPAPVSNPPQRSIAAVPVSSDLNPGAPFWIAVVAAVILLGATSLILGDPDVEEVSRESRSATPLARALSERGVGSRGTHTPTPRSV